MNYAIKWCAIIFMLLISNNVLAETNVLMIINEGFWAPEYYKPRERFDKEGYRITVAAKRLGSIKPDERNTDFKAVDSQISFSKIRVQDYDAIVFAGGNGAWTDYFPNEDAHKIVQDALAENKILALLCSSTGLLGVAKNFDALTPIAANRKATGYYRVRALIEKVGKIKYDPGLENKPYVVVDGNLITGRDPLSSELFAETIVKELKGRSKK